MNAGEFVKKMYLLAKNFEDFNDLSSLSSVAGIVRSYKLQKKNGCDNPDPIIELQNMYYLNGFEICFFSFFDKPLKDENYVIYGNFEGDYFAKDLQTGEIVLLDGMKAGCKMSCIAKNSYYYLDVLHVLACRSWPFVGVESDSYKNETAELCIKASGINTSCGFYHSLLG